MTSDSMKRKVEAEFGIQNNERFQICIFFALHFLHNQTKFTNKQLGKDKMITSNKIEVHTPKKLFLPSL